MNNRRINWEGKSEGSAEKYQQSCNRLKYQMRLLYPASALSVGLESATDEKKEEINKLVQDNPIDAMDEIVKQFISNIAEKSFSLMDCMDTRIGFLPQNQKKEAWGYFSEIIDSLLENIKDPHNQKKNKKLASLLNQPSKTHLRTNNDDKIKAIGFFILSAILFTLAISLILISIKSTIIAIMVADLFSCGMVYGSMMSFRRGITHFSHYNHSSFDSSIAKALADESVKEPIQTAQNRLG